MSRLEIKRLDSPLARSTREPTDPADDERPQEDQRQATSRPKRQRTEERRKPSAGQRAAGVARRDSGELRPA